MYYDVISAEYLGGYRLKVVFENGRSGVVDCQKFIDKGGVFEKFRDLDYFQKFTINSELGVITWEEEVDIAPETLYHEATREPLPAWQEEEAKMRKIA